MRVKIGNQWFSVRVDRPIVIELTEADRRNIANMHPDATRYGVFDDDDRTPPEQKIAWMAEG